MYKRLARPLLALLIALPSVAFAMELIPLVGYTGGGQFEDSISGETITVQESRSLGIIAAFDSSADKQTELLYSYQSSQLSDDEGFSTSPLFDIRFHYLHFGGSYFFNGRSKLSPFVAGGLGLTWIDPRIENGNSTVRPSMSLAFGIDWKLTETLGLRGELRGFGTLIDSSTLIICSGGCNVRIDGGLLTQYQINTGIVLRF